MSNAAIRRLQGQGQRLLSLSCLFPGVTRLENNVHGTIREESSSSRVDTGGDNTREEILERALQNVPQFGFTRKSLEAAAVDLSLSKACAGAIKPAEVVHYFNSIANDQLERILADAGAAPEWKHDKTLHEKLAHGVNTRLDILAPYKRVWSSALAAQAYHDEAVHVFGSAERMLNSIWAFANGEQGSEVDLTWYTRRILLGAIVQAAEVYMLTDDSPDLQDTKAFVDRGLSLVLV